MNDFEKAVESAFLRTANTQERECFFRSKSESSLEKAAKWLAPLREELVAACVLLNSLGRSVELSAGETWTVAGRMAFAWVSASGCPAIVFKVCARHEGGVHLGMVQVGGETVAQSSDAGDLRKHALKAFEFWAEALPTQNLNPDNL